MIRRFHLIQELSRNHEVHAIVSQPLHEFRHPKDGYTFPASTTIHSILESPPPPTVFDRLPGRLGPALLYRWLRRSWRGPTNSGVLETYHLIQRILKDYPIDAVIFGDLSTMLSAPIVKRLSPKSIRILNADNVDHSLLAQELQNQNGGNTKRHELEQSYAQTRWHESHLAQYVDAFFACSSEDQEVLASLNGTKTKGFTIPNGVDTAARPYDASIHKRDSRELIFCGTLSYPPNRDGLLWFHEQIWPLIVHRHPDLRLVVIGWGAAKESFDQLCVDPTVDFIGQVDNSIPYYHRSGITVVPLRWGSGTRLKILDSMSLGNPVISTRAGAAGLVAIDGKHLLLADTPTSFAEAVDRLLCEGALFDRLRTSARAFVEQQYDWRIVGQAINKALNHLLAEKDPSLEY